MRKDKGLNGDLDRLPMLTWIMFLKFLDDMERMRETNAQLAGQPFRPDLAAPYRWRDWGADPGGITGDELSAFVNNDEAVRPDGRRGLRSLDGGDRRDVVSTVFKGMQNRMVDGYLLRDVINLVNRIHFTASEEMHTLSRLYETLLREMRDAAGDSGEFYTPRPAVRFMVQVTEPRLGETVLDPACGTGGFLVEVFLYLLAQCRSVADQETLQNNSIRGGEAKSLPYLLAQMNLLLHGLDHPRIDPGNSLRIPLRDITDKDRVDLILTNVPFGGEEDKGILGNFPKDRQTAETALLFLQLIMRKLRRPGAGNDRGGRAGVIVPNGTLFGDGVCARVKEDLLKHYNLHTIVRLPEGIFAPYTEIASNLIFFDRSGPTQDIWYYQVPLPEGRRKYTKTKPMEDADLAGCLAWWHNRAEGPNAWRVSAADLLKYDAEGRLVSVNLDIKNPNSLDALEHREPVDLLGDIVETERKLLDLLAEIRVILDEAPA